MSQLILKDVCKTFGDKTVVDHVSFRLDQPGVYGLLGTNGAGKTTTIRMLLGILNKDSGEITWNGSEIKRSEINFGYLPEERGIYPKTKILDQLLYFAELKHMPKADALNSIRTWADKLRVSEYLTLPAEKLSKGNQQKIQLMTAIIHNPDLVVLDEPFSGLDPINTEIVKNIIVELTQSGKFVIMSAHQMSTIEEFCSDILILDHGKTVLQGNLHNIKRQYPANHLSIITDANIDQYLQDFVIEKQDDAQYLLKIPSEHSAQQLLQQLVTDNIAIEKFEIMRPTLNDIFIEKIGANS